MATEPMTSRALTSIRRERVRQEVIRRWKRPSVAVAVALAGVFVTMRAHPGPSLHGRGLAISIGLACFILGALAVAYAMDRLPRLLLGAAALTFASSVVLLWFQPHESIGILGSVLAFTAITVQLRERSVLVAGLTGILFLALVAEMSRHGSLVASLAFCFPPLAVSWLVLLFGRLRDAKEQAEELLVELAESRSAEARAAALAARYHLAREMHDVLAHSLSALILQLEGARMLAESDPADPRLPEAVGRAHESAKDGLQEARQAIGMLRGAELPGPVALSTLTTQFERRSGISCSFDTAGHARNVRQDARLALYRVTQEALTNVIKHSDAERVEVRLVYEPGTVRLVVEDFGVRLCPAAAGGSASHDTGHGQAVAGSGYGLTGMRERAGLLGGTLTAGATPAGFRVEMQVPA